MSAVEELHRMLDGLDEARARLVLEALRQGDPVLLRLALAPEDDESTTPEEDAGAAEAHAEYRRGEGRPWSEVRREMRRG